MDLLLVVLLVLALGGVVAVALGRVGGGLAPVREDVAPPLDAVVSRPSDLDRARFTLALRGYRMDQVDAVLDQARDLLAARDAEIHRLRHLVPVEANAPVEPRPVEPPPVEPAPVEPPPVEPAPVEPPPVEHGAEPTPVDPRR